MKQVKIIVIIFLLISPIFIVKGNDEPNYHVINTDQVLTIKRIANDEQALNEIISYTVLAQTLVLISAQGISSFAFISKLSLFQYLKVFIPFLIAQKAPRNDFSGLVYDALTSKPIPFAVIRVVNCADNRVIQTGISDIEGRYGLLLKPGLYSIEVQHQDYEFPVLDRNISAVQNDNNSYFGGNIKIKDEIAINFNLPMNPRVNHNKLSINKIRSLIINSYIFKFTQNLYFIYTVFLFSLFLLLGEFSWVMLGITIYYGVFSILHLLAHLKKLPKTWGRVVDATTKNPIKNIFLKFYSNEGKLIDSKITDETGRFQLFLNDGEYFTLVQSNSYKIAANKGKVDLNKNPDRVFFKVKKKAINLNIELEQLT